MKNAIEKSIVLESMQRDTINGIYDLKNQLISQTQKSELPYPWEEHFSESQGIFYYYNPDTGVSSWEFPSDPIESKMSLIELMEDCDVLHTSEKSTSDSITTPRRIEDDLIRKGQLYQNRREELRKQDEERFAEENTGRPQITKLADKMYKSRGDGVHGNLTIAERSKRMLEAKKAKEEKLRKEIELRESQEVR